ncbi:MAG TPA: molybdenum ABC transporter ATP-binding protein [Casimicrobiaceae bacterium]|nr:molybdenum ABC transporter ATP-binding protein [Casimicrobiaceae bacterium]
MADAALAAGRAVIEIDIERRVGSFHLDVRFEAEAPIVGLFGRSGSGKTSVVNAIAGIVRPSRGSIRINEVCLFDSARGIDVAPEKRRIGYVFQDALLFPHMDVEANLVYGQRLRAPADRLINEAHVVELLGLRPLLRRQPQTLSGGEKQRVAIGRALLAQPRILLMDEPLASLDGPRKMEILAYIELLRDDLDIPIVYVTHSVAEITRLADKIVVLSEGKCVGVGGINDVLDQLELEGAAERYEPASVIEARVAAQDANDRLTTLAFDGGELVVPHLDVAVGERARVRILARDVSLSIGEPRGISILNALPAWVTSISETDDAVVDVRLVVGNAALIARIARRSLQQLGITRGQGVYALVKAASLDSRGGGA